MKKNIIAFVISFVLIQFLTAPSVFACHLDPQSLQQAINTCLSAQGEQEIGLMPNGILRCYNAQAFGCGTNYCDFRVQQVCESLPPPAPNNPTNPPGGPNRCQQGSIIMVEKNSVGESVDIVGTPFFVNYMNHKVARVAERTTRVQLIGNIVHPTVEAVNVKVLIAGREINYQFPNPTPNQFFYFTWDGKDANGNTVLGSREAEILVTNQATTPYTQVTQLFKVRLRNIDFKNMGLGGWTFNVHHFYDIDEKILYRGDGTDTSAKGFLMPSGEWGVTSSDGSEVYVFNNQGVHLKTLFGKKGFDKYTFNYDTSGRLLSIVDFNNLTTTIERDANQNPTAIIGNYAQKTVLAVNSQGYLRLIRNPKGERHDMTYFSGGLLSTYKNPRSVTTTFAYDSLGRLVQDTSAAGSSVTLTLQNLISGNSTTTTSAMGLVKTYRTTNLATTDNNDYSSKVSVSTLQYTDTRYYISKNDGFLGTTQNISDVGVIVDTIGFPADPRLGYMYNPKVTTSLPNNLNKQIVNKVRTSQINNENIFDIVLETQTTTETTHPNGPQTSTLVYDGSASEYTATSPAGRVQKIKIDAFERPIELQNGTDRALQMIYDPQGRLQKITQGSRNTTYYYDSRGRVRATRNGLGQISRYTYDAADRIVSETLPDERIINYSYDANGNLTSVTPPGQPTHELLYNNFDLLSGYLLSNQTTYAYDNDRKLTSVARPNGDQINYLYQESTGRLRSINSTQGNYTFTLGDFYNHTNSSRSPDGVVENYTYTGNYLLSAQLSGPTTGRFSRTLNNSFLTATSQVNGGVPINYSYDNDSLLTQVGDLLIYRSAVNGRPSRTQVDRTVQNLYYNAFGELRALKNRYTAARIYHDFSYTRDRLGRITKKVQTFENSPQETFDYVYDTAGRLSSVSKNGVLENQHVYDSNSNRIQVVKNGSTISASYDTRDQIQSYGSLQFTHNLNGELISIVDTSNLQGGVTSFSYDVFGHLKSAVLPNNTTITYLLNASGQRVGKQINGVLNKQYVWEDSLRLAAELNPSGQVISQFIYGDSVNSPEYMIRDNIRYRFLKDHLGSVLAVVNSLNGAIAQQITYDEFGQVLSDSNPGFQPFGFAGGMYDPDTKLVRFGAREYNGAIGRWMSKDPILFNGGDTNLYGYVMQDPVNYFDPSGLYSEIGPVVPPDLPTVDLRPAPSIPPGRTPRPFLPGIEPPPLPRPPRTEPPKIPPPPGSEGPVYKFVPRYPGGGGGVRGCNGSGTGFA